MDNKKLLYKSFSEALQIDESLISDNLRYQSIPEWDSIAHMVLINEIETNFDIILSTDEVIDLSSVEEAKKILLSHNINI